MTNFNFEHFWLNEGFTVFIERKILGRLEGSKSQDFHAWGGLADLTETVSSQGFEFNNFLNVQAKKKLKILHS